MYVVKTIDDILKDGLDKYKDYKLCYIDEISKTITEYDEESIKIKNSPGFSYKTDSWKLRVVDVPNPDYIDGKQDHYAYFTPISLDTQWGDDWDDSPYDCNSGIPYDSSIIDGVRKHIEIIQIPFCKKYNFRLTNDLSHRDCPFSVKDINRGVVCWMFLENDQDDYSVIYGGDSIEKFIKTLILWGNL